MDEQAFELLTKLYSKVENIDKRVGSIEKIVAKIENHHGHKLEALFDGYKQTYEKVCSVENKLEKQEVEIRVVKGS
jgi:hypothetical protein